MRAGDPFFTQTNCDRCGNPLPVRIMSWFTKETICMTCSGKEQELRATLPDHGSDFEGCGYIPVPHSFTGDIFKRRRQWPVQSTEKEIYTMEKNWYEELGRACAQEFGLKEGTPIEHQTGTVWVPDSDGRVLAISAMKTEELGD